MLSVKLRIYLCFILFSLCFFPIASQVIPCPSLNNYITDLENYYTLGTRQISGSITDYMDIQGSIELTKQDYDYAIIGYGFFKVINEIDSNVYYTRCGKFTKQGNSFYTENNHKVVLSKSDFVQLYDVKKSNAVITLFYPNNNQEIRILDNKKWTTNTDCKTVKVNVVFHALEQNPVELRDLLVRIREEICKSNEEKNNSNKNICIKLIDQILGKIKVKDNRVVIDHETFNKTRQLISQLINLEEEKRAN